MLISRLRSPPFSGSPASSCKPLAVLLGGLGGAALVAAWVLGAPPARRALPVALTFQTEKAVAVRRSVSLALRVNRGAIHVQGRNNQAYHQSFRSCTSRAAGIWARVIDIDRPSWTRQ